VNGTGIVRWKRSRPTPSRPAGFFVAIGLFLACLCSHTDARAQAEAYIEIRKSDFFQIPVVVEDFEREGFEPVRFQGGSSLEGVLTQDLLFTDAILVVRLRMGEPLPAGLTLDARGMPLDRAVQARVRGKVKRKRNGFEVRAALLDEGTGKEIFERRYRITQDEDGQADPWGIHRLADDVVFFLTGTRGCAATRIAHVRVAEGGKELFIIDWDGLNEEPLTALRSIVVSPAWHPSGSRVACTSYHHGQPQLVSVGLSDGRVRTLSAEPMPTAAAYAPDGKQIAFSTTRDGNAEIYVARADGSRAKRLTVNRAIDTSPSWAPSGKRLVFTSDRCGTAQLFLIDVDGSNLEQLTFTGKWNDSPDWSPQTDRIVHVCRFDGVFELALINADGSGWRRLTVGGGCENPRWAPDGRHVVFARSREGVRNLWILGVDSSSLRQLTASKTDSYNPAWSRPSKDRLCTPN
jgi:TolB protein